LRETRSRRPWVRTTAPSTLNKADGRGGCGVRHRA
jgi:hypothetical protein